MGLSYYYTRCSMLNRIKITLLMLIILGVVQVAQASVVLESTRVIYHANKKDATLTVNNPDDQPYLIQSWVGSENSDAPENNPLFITTPPLFRLDAKQSNTLRIIYMEDRGSLPKNKQSVFWLNVKAIPSSNPSAKDTLSISINTRIKLFYTPDGLSQDAFDMAFKNLTFSISGNQLTVKNPTPYYVTLAKLAVGSHEIDKPGMIAPESLINFIIPDNTTTRKISWSAINSYGGVTENLVN